MKKGNKSNINPSFLEHSANQKAKRKEASFYIDGIRSGDRLVLSKAITLAESKNADDRKLFDQILKASSPTKISMRVGISGSPGVGKSSLIESLGLQLIEMGYRPAVLAIDPTSTVSRGSVLGDKTRMPELSKREEAYIRPTSSGGILGGIHRNTKEAMMLCEAAGFDVILIETVGVGQAETKVHELVDFFCLLILPGAGDELQGIKRGIVELADLVLINKSDGERISLARKTRQSYTNALHLLGPKENNWSVKCLNVSALENKGIDEAWKIISEFFENNSEFISSERLQQDISWFKENVKRILYDRLFAEAEISAQYNTILQSILEGKSSPFEAYDKFRNFINGIK